MLKISALHPVCICSTVGYSDAVKDLFYDQLCALTAMIPALESLIPCDGRQYKVRLKEKYTEAVVMASQTLKLWVRGEMIQEYLYICT